MEKFISKCGKLTWNVIDNWQKQDPTGTKMMHYRVACAKCGHEREGRKYDIKKRTTCPGCIKKQKVTSEGQLPFKKPAAVKLDDSGACVSICEIGTVEYVREYQEEHRVSEREAVSMFIEAAKAHLDSDDPIQDQLTPESVRAKVRRNTGKKDHQVKRQARGEAPQKFRIEPTIDSVKTFIGKHLPNYQLTHVGTGKL